VAEKGLLYMGMGVSGGEEGARNGPAMMPGGTKEAWEIIKDVVTPVSAQVCPRAPCVLMWHPPCTRPHASSCIMRRWTAVRA
jgi:6-phosphogluconate dehydrogenase